MRNRVICCAAAAALLLTGCGMKSSEEKDLIDTLKNTYGEDFRITGSYIESGRKSGSHVRRLTILPESHPEDRFEAMIKVTASKNSRGTEYECYYTEGVLGHRAADLMTGQLKGAFGDSTAVYADLNHDCDMLCKPAAKATFEEFFDYAGDRDAYSDAVYQIAVNTDVYRDTDGAAEYEAVCGGLQTISEKIGLGGTAIVYFLGADDFGKYTEWFSEHVEQPEADSAAGKILNGVSYPFAYDLELHEITSDTMTKEQYIAKRNETFEQ